MGKQGDKPGLDRKMTGDEINRLPVRRYQGKVHIISRRETLRKAVHQLRTEKLLGFDTETQPTFRKGENHPVSIVQLAARDAVYVFSLSSIGFPRGLRSILADKRIIKAGAGLDHDIQKLMELGPFKPRGFIDIGDIARKKGIMNHGLRGMAAVLLGFRISKQAQRSNWGRQRLTAAQITYAATDAWVSRKLYRALERFESDED